MSWTEGPTSAVDQVALRRQNHSLVLRHVRGNGPRPHAHLVVLERVFSAPTGVPEVAPAFVETPGGAR